MVRLLRALPMLLLVAACDPTAVVDAGPGGTGENEFPDPRPDGAGACEPLAAEDCDCDGTVGVRHCAWDGSGWGACRCDNPYPRAAGTSGSPCASDGTCDEGLLCDTDTNLCISCEYGGPGEDVGNPCYRWPCENGGHCSTDGTTATCACLPGFTGDRCQTATSEGTGTFGESFALDLFEGVSGSAYVATVGDLNADGRADLAFTGVYASLADGEDALYVRFATGGGSFGPATTMTVPDYFGEVSHDEFVPHPLALVAADLDGDGDGDLALLHPTADVYLFENNGSGGFTAGAVLETGFASELHQAGLGVADVNEDGAVDLLVSLAADNGADASTLVLAGAGGGTFGSPVEIHDGAGESFIVTDVNGDGHTDLGIWYRDRSTGEHLRFGAGDGSFPAGVHGGKRQHFADLDGDGDVDRISHGGPSYASFDVTGQIYVTRGRDGCGFQSVESFPTASYGSGGTDSGSGQLGDVDGDGVLDFVLATADVVELLTGDGDGTFTQTAGIPLAGGTKPLFLADINGDDAHDVLLLDSNQSLEIALGIPEGGLVVDAGPADAGFDAGFDAGPPPTGEYTTTPEVGVSCGLDLCTDETLAMCCWYVVEGPICATPTGCGGTGNLTSRLSCDDDNDCTAPNPQCCWNSATSTAGCSSECGSDRLDVCTGNADCAAADTMCCPLNKLILAGQVGGQFAPVGVCFDTGICQSVQGL